MFLAKSFAFYFIILCKEEFLDVVYWMRQALGIIVGILWGLIPMKGFLALLLFVLVNAVVIYLYFSSFQSIDEEEYGGAWELLKEGFMTSFAGFLVTWIIVFSGLHYE
ncbi:GEL complex subunit OPTI isoform X2 [Lycorma delicatula]|uniref:GEL complex subunit OPTI isoform X2 n=1 Tax=Lycorma delicatula TaxID=130591 RepID=UPI003F519856